MWFVCYEFGCNWRNYLLPSEVNVSIPPYRLLSTLLTSKEAEAHFGHFPFPDYLKDGEERDRNMQCYWEDWGGWLIVAKGC